MRTALPLAAAAFLLTLAACGPSANTESSAPGQETVQTPTHIPTLPDAQALGVPDDPDAIRDGRVIAESHCGACHALDHDASPRLEAPPLRHVLSLYPPESLAEDFRNGIHVGHEDMPDFVFGPLGMDVLLAYLVSIQEVPPARP